MSSLTEQAARRARLRAFREGLGRWIAGFATSLLLLTLLAIPLFILRELLGSASISTDIGYVGVLLFGTLKATFAALLIAIPLAIGAAIHVAMFASPAWRERLRAGMELLEALPSVVIGLVAAIWLAPLLKAYGVAVLIALLATVLIVVILARYAPLQRRRTLAKLPWLLIPLPLLALLMAVAGIPVVESWQPSNPWNTLLVGVAMGLANVPLLFNLVESALRNASARYGSSALALGARPRQLLSHLLLPIAMPSMLAAVCTVAARCSGETMIVLMASANTPLLGPDPFDGLRSLAADLVLSLPHAEPASSLYTRLLLAAMLLFVISMVLDAGARRIARSRIAAGFAE